MSPDPVLFSDAINVFTDEVSAAADHVRFPLQRTGEREPISSMLRLLVWLRDEGRCVRCGEDSRDRLTQLDHVVPWSAGGADCGSNLRVLCQPCNQQRSNFLEPGGTRHRAVTPMCDVCIERHGQQLRHWRRRKRHDLLLERRPIGCPVCTGTADLFPETTEGVTAYCGWCNHTSFVSDPRRVL